MYYGLKKKKSFHRDIEYKGFSDLMEKVRCHFSGLSHCETHFHDLLFFFFKLK